MPGNATWPDTVTLRFPRWRTVGWPPPGPSGQPGPGQWATEQKGGSLGTLHPHLPRTGLHGPHWPACWAQTWSPNRPLGTQGLFHPASGLELNVPFGNCVGIVGCIGASPAAPKTHSSAPGRQNVPGREPGPCIHPPRPSCRQVTAVKPLAANLRDPGGGGALSDKIIKFRGGLK